MSWDNYADGWDRDEAVRTYSRAAFDRLTRICGERGIRLEGARICDFGCGTGLLTEKLAPVCSDVVAVDTSVRMLDQLRGKIERLGLSNVRTTSEAVTHGGLREDALLGLPFDLIVCSSVCGFLDDYPGTVGTLVRLLGPGGLFVQFDWEPDPHSQEPFGLNRDQVKQTLSDSGLEAIEVETAFEVSTGDQTMRPLMGVGQAPSLDWEPGNSGNTSMDSQG